MSRDSPAARLTSRRLSVAVSWSLVLLALVTLALGTWFRGLAPADLASPLPPEAVTFIIVSLAFLVVGALITSRYPRNAVGWCYVTVGSFAPVQFLTFGYAQFAVLGRSEPLPGGVFAAWFGSWQFFVLAGAVTFGILLFPNGRLPSRRWRPVAWATATLFGTLTLLGALQDGALPDFPTVRNPYGVPPVTELLDVAESGFTIAIFVVFIVAVVSTVARLRAATGVARQQLKWFVYAAALLLAALLVEQVVPIPEPYGPLPLLLVPGAVGIAMLRYRLYDIDLLINRTLVYGAVSATLLATYALAVVLLQQLFRPLTTGNDVAIAASTLAVATLFQPVRRRIQDAVDRRFYRRKYDAQRTLSLFSGRLRQEIDLDTLSRELLAVVGETMQPASATLWLREKKR